MTQPHRQTVRRVIDSGQVIAREYSERLIQQSWLRCAQEHGLHPERNPGIPDVAATNLREHRQQIGAYLDIARAGMHELYPHIAGLGYVTMLADADGVTLDCLGSENADPALATAGLRPGTVWHEAIGGTNGIGTCIAERRTPNAEQNKKPRGRPRVFRTIRVDGPSGASDTRCLDLRRTDLSSPHYLACRPCSRNTHSSRTLYSRSAS